MEGGKAVPEYNLFDLMENAVEKKDIEPVSLVKVLVPISNPKHERDLLKLAYFMGSEIICLHIIEVPDQTMLKFAQEAYHEKNIEIDCHFKEEFDNYPAILGHKREYVVAFDHRISNSIMEQAEIEHADMIIMGWHEPKRFEYSLGVTNDVLLSSKSPIALLKGHLPDSINKILVGYNGKENSLYGLYLAEKLVVNTGAVIDVISIVSPDETKETRQKITDEFERQVEKISSVPVSFRVMEKYSIEDALLEASNNNDLTIIGDSSERFKISLLGTLSQRVARHSQKPIVIVKKSRPISKESLIIWLKSLSAKYMQDSGRKKVKTTTDKPSERFWSK
jgi:nucleotide-binding universal stress UspA family protein